MTSLSKSERTFTRTPVMIHLNHVIQLQAILILQKETKLKITEIIQLQKSIQNKETSVNKIRARAVKSITYIT